MNPALTRIPQGWYQPTPFGKLRAISAFGLLNVVVRTAEADARTNGAFDLELGLRLSAVVRQFYFTRGAPGTSSIYYKQRFLACCFVGPKSVLDRLWLAPSPDILPNWVALLAEHLGWSADVIVFSHPYLEPAGRAVEIGRANEREWLKRQHAVMTGHGHELEGFVKQPGALPLWQYHATPDAKTDAP